MPSEPELAGLDWSMGSRSIAIIDWDAAMAVGRRVAGRGPATTPAQRDALRADLRELVPLAESLVVDVGAVFGVDRNLNIALGDTSRMSVRGTPVRLSESVTAYVSD